MAANLFTIKGLHVKCRNISKPYLRSNVFRLHVEDDKVDWKVKFDEYIPPDYTAESVNGKPWADPADPRCCAFNTCDSGVMRTSYHGPYLLDPVHGRPINPFGRTGLRGRGVLRRWGPNHAGDAIISRHGGKHLEFIAIKRGDTGELAIPGGMVDRGESPSKAVVREFIEEVLAGETPEKLENFWKGGKEVYKGYVDDPRNTDNAWMETICINFHDSDGFFEELELKAGDDAKEANWTRVSSDLRLYASHEHLINLFEKLHGLI